MGGELVIYGDACSIADSDVSIEVPTFNVELLLELISDSQCGVKELLNNAIEVFATGIKCSDRTDLMKEFAKDAETFYNEFCVYKEKAEFYLHQNNCVFRCYDDTQRAPAQDDPRWLVMRNGGIGASEAEQVPAKDGPGKIKFIKEKAGVIKRSFTGNEITEQGHQMEPVVGKVLDDMYDTFLLESTSLEHLKYPFIRASLDRYGWVNGLPHIIEIKSPVSRIPIWNSIPKGYDMQMYQQHEVSQIENGLFADCQFQLFDTYGEMRSSFRDGENLKKKYFGAVIKYPHNSRAWTYSPVSQRHKLREWVAQKTKELNHHGYRIVGPLENWKVDMTKWAWTVKIAYYRVHRFVLVPHVINKNWCNDWLHRYRELWDKVEEYKAGYKDTADIERLETDGLFSDDDDDKPEEIVYHPLFVPKNKKESKDDNAHNNVAKDEDKDNTDDVIIINNDCEKYISNALFNKL